MKGTYGFCIIINDSKEILVLRRSNAPNRPYEWDLPGGRINTGEDVRDGIFREVFEETGLELSEYEVVIDRSGHFARFIYASSALGEGQEVKLSYEHTDHIWVGLSQAVELIEFRPHNMALKFLSQSF